MPDLVHEFAAPVLRQDDGFRYHVLPLPAEVAAAYEALGLRRLVATVNGHALRRAVNGRADGERFLILGRDALRLLGLAHGDTAVVRLEPDPEPDAVDVGEAFEAVLADDPEAAARWRSFPVGRQRSLAHYLTSAKRPETQAKRALEVAHKLRTHTLYGDLHPDRR